MLRRGGSSQRLLTTVLFTDIVGSTERAAELGDRGWKDLVGRHHALIRRELRRFHGREIDTAGDGFFATFDRPAQAIECATSIIDDLRPLDLHIRAAIHMGEAEVMGSKVGGITVHVASRALAHAGSDEVLVTSTVRDVTVGADVTFTDRGVHEFKGVPGEWRLFAVAWQRRPLPAAAAPAEGGRPRRLGPVAALAGVVLCGALVAAYALLPRGSAAISPQADSVMAIDESTVDVRAVVPAIQSPTDIAIDAETAWVLSLEKNVLYAIPLSGGPSVPIGLEGVPTGIAAGGGSVWVTFGLGGENQGNVVRYGTTSQRKEDSVWIGSGVNAIALDATGVYVTNAVASTLTKIDPETRTNVRAPVDVDQQPIAVAVGGGSVWVAHVVSKTVWRLDPVTLQKLGTAISLRTSPTAMAYGFGRLWVTSTAGNAVYVIDPATGLSVTIPVDSGPRGITIGSAAVWVAGTRNALVRIDPTSRVTRTITLPAPGWGVAASGGRVWVTVQK